MKGLYLTGFADEASPDLKGQIEALKRNGMGYIEIRNLEGGSVIDLSDEELLSVRSTLDKEGIKVSSIGSPIGKYPVTDDFEPHFQRFKRALSCAEILGAKYIRMFSFFIPKGEEADKFEEEVLRRIGIMTDCAKSHGVVLCHENETGIYGCSPENCLNLQKKLPDLRAVFDPCNYIMDGFYAEKALPLMLPYIEYVHIKDGCRSDRAIVPAGFGDGKIESLIKAVGEFREDRETFVSAEPHLNEFVGYGTFDERKMVHHFKYDNTDESFDASVGAIKNILTNLGYKEGENYLWVK